MSIESLEYSSDPLPPKKQTRKGTKRKSDIVEKKVILCPVTKRQRILRGYRQDDERESLKMEEQQEGEKVEEMGEANQQENGNQGNTNTEQTNQSNFRTTPGQANPLERELVCRICQKQFHELNNLSLHEKIPHFWSCTHRGCELAFETKTDRATHVEESHTAEQFSSGGGDANLDHLVMNADGTMSFNYLTSATTKGRSRRHYHQAVDLAKLAKNSDYGGNRNKNGFVSRASYRTRTKNEKWKKDDTTKFYKNLSIYGCNFALLAALFKGRSRKQLKNKYKKEERENPKLIKNALTNRQPMDLHIDEFEEIVTENMKAKQTLAQKADGVNVIKKKKVGKVKTVRERRSNRQQTATKVLLRETSFTSVVEQRVHSPAELEQSLLELAPPSAAEEVKSQDDESSAYEFDPFA